MKIQKITQWKSLCTALVCRKINRFIWKNKPKNLNIKTLPDISFRGFFPSFYFFSLPFENHSVSWLQEKWNFQFVIQDDSEWKIYPVTARRGAYIRTNTSHFLQSWRVMSCINSTPLLSEGDKKNHLKKTKCWFTFQGTEIHKVLKITMWQLVKTKHYN